MWRLALHPRITDSLDTIKTKWTLDDALDAHLALNYFEDRAAEEQQIAKREAERRRRR